jgi:hypothetical protein
VHPLRRSPDRLARFDDRLRALYAQGVKRGQLQRLAAEWGVGRSFVLRRAQELGVASPRRGVAPWTDRELEILAASVARGANAEAIARSLRRHGHDRTTTAVALQLKRRAVSQGSPDRWTATGLAALMGVETRVVLRWIEREQLPARRRGSRRTSAQGGDAWTIERAALRRWIRDHAILVDLRRVDRFWFIDLAFR